MAYSLPENFELFESNSNFLVNYWDTFITLIIILGFYLMITTVLCIVKKKANENLVIIFERMRIILGSNLFLLIFCGAYDEIALYTSL